MLPAECRDSGGGRGIGEVGDEGFLASSQRGAELDNRMLISNFDVTISLHNRRLTVIVL